MKNPTNKTKRSKRKPKERAQSYYGYITTASQLYEQSQKGTNFTDLMSLVIMNRNIAQAYRSLKRNKGAKTSGTDRKDIETYANMELGTLENTIKNKMKNYKPGSVRRKMIPKKKPGEFRPLGIPNTIDKIIQQCIKQIIEPILEAKFETCSYAFRPARNQHQAIEHIYRLIAQGKYTHAIEFDIRKYFDSIDHKILLEILYRSGIKDKKLLQIIKAILKAPVKGEGIPQKGTPQGGVISPLLANIYLNELDKYIHELYQAQEEKVKRNRKKYKVRPINIVRYADDFVLFTKSRKDAVYYQDLIIQWLKMFKLEHAPEKTHIRNLKKKAIMFLGIQIKAAKSKDTKYKFLVAKSYVPKESIIRTAEKVKRTIPALRKTVIQGLMNYIMIATDVSTAARKLYHKLYRNKIIKLKRKKAFRQTQANGVAVDLESLFKNVHYKFMQLPCQDSYLIHLQNIREYDKLSTWYKDNQDIVEKYDIIRSLFAAQKGKDTITKEELIRPHCHRKIPGTKGGKYIYQNCILLQDSTHRSIHGSQENLEEFCRLRKLGFKQILCITGLWKLAH